MELWIIDASFVDVRPDDLFIRNFFPISNSIYFSVSLVRNLTSIAFFFSFYFIRVSVKIPLFEKKKQSFKIITEN